MWFLTFAMRRPFTIMVALVALAIGALVAARQIPVDIFPKFNTPVIYVCQPYGGMDPAQMEGLITNYYEFHFLYINGIHHVESRNVHGVALMKLMFHPGTNMAQAMAETITHVNRSRAFMPAGTVPPFVMRFDTGSVPVGYLVLSSENRSIGEIQDAALFKVRPMFASLPGVSAPPPFGGNQRTIILHANPEKLRAYGLSAEDLMTSLASGNTVSPSGNLRVGNEFPIVPVNSLVKSIKDLEKIPIRHGQGPELFLRDVAWVEDGMDIPTGYALVDGRRAIYMTVTKRADASTLSVVDAVRNAVPSIQDALPEDIQVGFQFDQTPFVIRSLNGLAFEGLLGALLTGLMVVLFLRDARSALVVILNIPLALMGALLGLWLTGQTLNIITLGGLALAVGILVDEATVEIENIHTQLRRSKSVARAVRLGNAQTALPRLLSMVCILSAFLPALLMEGASGALFRPLALAVTFSMFTSYVLSSTFVPIATVWLLRRNELHDGMASTPVPSAIFSAFSRSTAFFIRQRQLLLIAYISGSFLLLLGLAPQLGVEIFPQVDTGEFRLRIRAPAGTHIEKTEQIALKVLDRVRREIGEDNIAVTLGYVGSIPSTYPVQAVYQWSRGPEEATVRVALKPEANLPLEPLKEKLRQVLATDFPELRCSFEPADIVNEVMSIGSATPIEVAVNGPDLAINRAYLLKVREKLAEIPFLRDLQVVQTLDYPAVAVDVDREKAGRAGVTAADVSRSLVAATSSSRFVLPNYWPDPVTGVGYQVQVEIPQHQVTSVEQLRSIPVRSEDGPARLLRDVAQVQRSTVAGQYDRYNMRRELSLSANISGADLGSVSRQVADAIAAVGEPPRGSTVEIRGQVPTLREMLSGLTAGLLLSVVVILLVLSSNFQSLSLAFVVVSSVPATMVGIVLALWVTGTTLNLQSFMGAIMAVGVAMANAILLVSFAEERRRAGLPIEEAAREAALARVRPVLMTSLAMIVGMLPMALAIGEGAEQTAPLGRAVVGGLLSATIATLLILPAIFVEVQSRGTTQSSSLDPDDPDSPFYDDWKEPDKAQPTLPSKGWRGLWVRKLLNSTHESNGKSSQKETTNDPL